MMILRNFDFSSKYYDILSKTELEETTSLKINGWYKFINGVLSALMVTDNKLYFLYGDDKTMITESYSVMLNRSGDSENLFILLDGDNVLCKFSYDIPNSELSVSPFEYIDEDDFRWGEFIAKIINNKERQRNFVMNLMEN